MGVQLMTLEELIKDLFPIDYNCGNIVVENGSIVRWTSVDPSILTEEELRILKNNKDIKNQLIDIDFKTIRALRAGDQEILDELEQEAVSLRAQLI
jgi:hypothetical protein